MGGLDLGEEDIDDLTVGFLEEAQIAAQPDHGEAIEGFLGGDNVGVLEDRVGSSNLVFNSGTLEYAGPTTSSDRGATLESTGGLSVTNATNTLTLSGALVGPGGLWRPDVLVPGDGGAEPRSSS